MERAGPTSETATADAAPWPIPAWTDPAIQALGRSDWLNSLGRRLGNAFHRLVPAGKAKDTLTGTWIGHPLHPILTDVTIGSWTSAAILDLLGNEKARPAADTLIGVGIISAVPTAITGLCDLTDIVDRGERSVGTAHAASPAE